MNISKMKADDILERMSHEEKRVLYDLLWKEFTAIDIKSCITEKLSNNNYSYNDIHDAIADEVVIRLADEYEPYGEPYWNAIEQLLDEYGL